MHCLNLYILQNVKEELDGFFRFRDDPVCTAQRGQISDCPVHTGKQNRAAQQNLQRNDGIEPVNKHIPAGNISPLQLFSPAISQLLPRSQAPHYREPLALREQKVVPDECSCLFQIVAFIDQVDSSF